MRWKSSLRLGASLRPWPKQTVFITHTSATQQIDLDFHVSTSFLHSSSALYHASPTRTDPSNFHRTSDLETPISTAIARTQSTPSNTHNDGVQTVLLAPAPPSNNPQHHLRHPCRLLSLRPPPILHDTRLQCDLQPSPARLPNRATRAQTHITCARRPTRNEGCLSSSGYDQAKEA